MLLLRDPAEAKYYVPPVDGRANRALEPDDGAVPTDILQLRARRLGAIARNGGVRLQRLAVCYYRRYTVLAERRSAT